MKKRLSSLTVKELRALAAEMGIRPIAARKSAIVQQIIKLVGESQSLYAMTVLQLRAYARAAGVRLKSTRKDAIIAELIMAKEPSPSKEETAAAAKPARAESLMKRARPKGSVKPASSKDWESLANGSTPGPHPVIGSTPPSVPAAEASAAKLSVSHRKIEVPPKPKHQAVEAAKGVEPVHQAEAPRTPSDEAPAGSIAAVAVEPDRIFAAWEITEHRSLKGDLVINLFDMSAEPFRQSETHVYLSFGGIFMQAHPGRIYMLELGEVTRDGAYTPLKHSEYFSTPSDEPSDKKGVSVLPESHFTEWKPSGGSPGL